MTTPKRRKPTQRERILARLEAGPTTNRDLNNIAFRFGARILELRSDGYDIRCYPLKPAKGLYIYSIGPLDMEDAA